ncbi:MAG: binding-protein-dependent transport system inner rane component [Frankiales bacterium]|nr:binding-protein-dependent transport system inner rane component [Frankiales bacterium]
MHILTSAVAHLDASNPWISVDFVRENADALKAATKQHVQLVLLSVGFGLLLAVPLALLVRGHRRLSGLLLGTTGVIYTIPSLALFALLAPITGLTLTTAVVGLTAYTLLILVRNVLAGLDGVPEEVRESARAMGMGRMRLLTRVELPLALPTIVAGVRVATVSNVALATVGVVVSYGGLGQIIFLGFRSNFYKAEIFTGTALCVLLAVIADLVFLGLERLLTPWARR